MRRAYGRVLTASAGMARAVASTQAAMPAEDQLLFDSDAHAQVDSVSTYGGWLPSSYAAATWHERDSLDGSEPMDRESASNDFSCSGSSAAQGCWHSGREHVPQGNTTSSVLNTPDEVLRNLHTRSWREPLDAARGLAAEQRKQDREPLATLGTEGRRGYGVVGRTVAAASASLLRRISRRHSIGSKVVKNVVSVHKCVCACVWLLSQFCMQMQRIVTKSNEKYEYAEQFR
jgi:hypothetical protein